MAFLKRELSAAPLSKPHFTWFRWSSYLDPSMSDAPSPAQITRSSTPIEMNEQEAMDQCSETCDETGEDADMDLGEGTSNASAASEPDPAPSANKPEHKSAFVKIMELDEPEMLTAYIEAFVGESLRYRLDHPTDGSHNRSLPLLQRVRWGPSREHQR